MDQTPLEILLSEEGIPENKFDSIEQIKLVRRGIFKNILDRIAEQSPISLNTILELLLISRRSYAGFGQNKSFSPVTSERILNITNVLTKGVDTFGNNKK